MIQIMIICYYKALINKISIMMGVNPTSNLNEINIKADVINLIPNNLTDYVNIYGNLAVTGTIGNTSGTVVPVPPRARFSLSTGVKYD